MVSWRKGLAVLGGITAVTVLSNELYYPYDKEVSQLIWDYIVDPAALLVLGLNVLVNVADSLRGWQPSGPMAPGRGHRSGGHRMGPLPNAVRRQDSTRP